jgi:hypothetical protein
MLGGWRSKEISGDSSSRYAVPVPAHPSQLGREGPGRGEPGSLRGPDAYREGTVQGERRHARPDGAVSGGRPQGERHAPAACGQLCQRQGNCDHLRSAGGPGPGFTPAQPALQGMARVRSGQAPAWPLSSDRECPQRLQCQACTFTAHLSPVLVALRSRSRFEAGGADTYIQRPSPDLSPARTLAPSACMPAAPSGMAGGSSCPGAGAWHNRSRLGRLDVCCPVTELEDLFLQGLPPSADDEGECRAS